MPSTRNSLRKVITRRRLIGAETNRLQEGNCGRWSEFLLTTRMPLRRGVRSATRLVIACRLKPNGNTRPETDPATIYFPGGRNGSKQTQSFKKQFPLPLARVLTERTGGACST